MTRFHKISWYCSGWTARTIDKRSHGNLFRQQFQITFKNRQGLLSFLHELGCTTALNSCMNSFLKSYDTVQITQELGSFTTTWLELLGSSVQSHCDFKQSELFMFMETWYSWTSAPNCICEILRFILSLRAAIFLGVFSIILWWISTNSLIWPCHHLVRVPFSITPPICPRDFLQKDAPGFCANTLQPG